MVSHKQSFWPKDVYPADEVLAMDREVREQPDLAVRRTEDIFRIEALGLEWDIGLGVTEPEDHRDAARAPDGRKTGFFLLHGGNGDFKSLDKLSYLLAAKYGHRAVSMSFPGRHAFMSDDRDWPGDTINADGTVRTPLWLNGEIIGPDQYDVVQDTSKRARYGIRTLAKAREGTIFWHRMAAWPVAFEEAMIEVCRRHFPANEWAIYTHGHSTGGAFSAMLTQKVSNVAGQAEIETAPIGFINTAKHGWSGSLGKIGNFERVTTKPAPRQDAFNELYIRTWRDIARYRGPEALGQEGPEALMRLPWLIEEVMENWERAKLRPNFKAEYIVTHNIEPSLEAAARAAADRLGMSKPAEAALIQRYLGYGRYEEGPDARPLPPIFYINTLNSRDNSREVYDQVVVPMLRDIKPAPRVAASQLGMGTHVYYKPETDLPEGVTTVAAKLWTDAIKGGFYDYGPGS